MDHGERRIRSLQLRGGDGTRLHQARYWLEEAFRTASLPGLPPNSVVLVRYLDLGDIHLERSATALALQIEEHVRELATTAVCVDECSAPQADVVWFSDPLQPYIGLLQQLLDGRATTEWYWKSLFDSQRYSLNEKTLNTLFLTIQHTAPGALASAHLLQSCLSSQRLACLMRLISPQMARQWLHASGVTPVAVDEGEIHPDEEAQIVWADGAASPPEPGSDWLRALSQAAQSWGSGDVRCHWLAYQALIFNYPAYSERSDALLQVKRWLPIWLADAKGISSLNCNPPGTAQLQTSSKEQIKNKPESTRWGVELPGRDVSFSAETGRIGGEIHVYKSMDDRTLLKSGQPESTAERDFDDHQPLPEAFSSRIQIGSWSDCAGLGFAINLLQRCGMAELMAHNECLVANDFHLHLLHAIARRFGMEEDDPLMPLFVALEDAGSMILNDVSLPPGCLPEMEWLPLRYRQPGRAMSAQQWMVVMQLLMGRYLRRHGHVSLRQLIHRPGRVVLSRSHWDVVFDIDQTDLRLRRLALDSDPGWVPWLGKVVQFHFDTQGYRYV